MQLALTNVGQTTFGQAKDEEMVRETVDEEEALSRQQSAISQDQHQDQRPFTAKDAQPPQQAKTRLAGVPGHAKEEQGLPRMGADESGLENPKPIVWKPTADMYRMDTPEGREAYEASFGTKIKETKIKPRAAGEPRPLQGIAQPGAAVPHEHAETYAILG
jgi:hypothetical protein